MRVYYCKKCKTESVSPICEHCGVQITALNQNERFKWRAVRIPLGDAPTVLGALKVLVLTVVCLVLVLFLGEIIFSADKQRALTMFSNSGILSWSLMIMAVGAALIFLDLGLRGREELQFVIENHGAHMQVCIEPSYLRCLARFINYEKNNVMVQPDGSERMLIGETHLLWQDVCRYEVRRHARRIDLYRPSGFLFMSLYAQEGELDALVDYMKPRMKHLVKPAK